MKSLEKFIAGVALAIICVSAFASTDPTPVKSFVAGSLDVREIKKSMSVYAVYAGDSDITAALRQRIAELGYPLADSADKANLVFKVTPVYVGKASDRPKAGTYDGNDGSSGFSIGRFLMWTAVGMAAGIKPEAGASALHASDVAAFWSGALHDSGATSAAEHAFKPTRKPQDAIVSQVEMIVNGVDQKAQVVSESYAQDVPAALLAGQNLKTAVWFLE